MEAALERAVQVVVAHQDFAATFKHPIKFNGTDFVETRLSAVEQLAEVHKLASKSLHVFLERYGTMLSTTDLDAIAATAAAQTPEVQHWVQRLGSKSITATEKQKRARRRRWGWARHQMQSPDGGFFNEEAMRRRNPQLFQRLVGRHVAGKPLTAPMKGSLSAHMLQQLDREMMQDDLTQTAAQGGADKADKGNDSDCSLEDEEGEADITAKRAEFLKLMRNRLVNGEEPNFDYSKIDDDSDLDDIQEQGRDAEESYFETD
eukprot:gnl/TRDRNA2_/TRDRNA2_36552_c0_seq1.p1 gnl/TRDRNA2_/TRDRNA2_36552_c0~~gnl/TRDRNA2_/TRDRNA2_36552_c0_seq1.p1  ORF type:complete len:261 (-),score=69.73 gnl/TRDRNA2_/TRDRNA2_36552_c0_seq1:73-855(-)